MDSDIKKRIEDGETKISWRIRIGTWMFYVPFAMIFGAPVVIPTLGFSATQAATIIGGILIAGEVIWFASIPLLGKKGFKKMKSQAFQLLKPKTGPISRSRHLIGVGMFVGGLVTQIALGTAVMAAYLKVGASDPGILVMGMDFETQAIVYVAIEIVAMACLMISIYVLGTDFWERLTHVFQWQKANPF